MKYILYTEFNESITNAYTVTVMELCEHGRGNSQTLSIISCIVYGFTVSPVINKALGKAAAQTQTDGKLKCTLEAFPQPTVTWTKDGTTLDLNSDKYVMTSSKAGQIDFSFVLTVTSVKEEDYGSYTCTATNDKGTDSHVIVLGGTSKLYIYH